jgi:tRNA threonylcarbamoyladenosine biosynthesis protein TsaB
MYLGLRTDAPVAQMYLYDGDTCVAEESWQADRQLAYGLLEHLERFLTAHECRFEELSGLFVYKGPGSFTGLRIGITVMNTIAYASTIPIIGETEDEWRHVAVQRLLDGQNDEIVLPFYGADPRITKPRK